MNYKKKDSGSSETKNGKADLLEKPLVKNGKKTKGHQRSAKKLDSRHEVSCEAGKRDFGLHERVENGFRSAGDKQFVRAGDGEEQPDRNAHEQDGVLFQITVARQHKLDRSQTLQPLSGGKGLLHLSPGKRLKNSHWRTIHAFASLH